MIVNINQYGKVKLEKWFENSFEEWEMRKRKLPDPKIVR